MALYAPIVALTPYASFALGTIYLMNDSKISALRRYVQSLTTEDADTRVFPWESVHLELQGRFPLKALQLAADFVVFGGTGITGAAIGLSREAVTTGEVLRATPGLLLLAILLIFMSLELRRALSS